MVEVKPEYFPLNFHLKHSQDEEFSHERKIFPSWN